MSTALYNGLQLAEAETLVAEQLRAATALAAYDNWTAAQFACRSEADLHSGAENLRSLKTLTHNLEESRKALVAPHVLANTTINSIYKHLVAKVDIVATALKKGMLDYQAQLAKEQAEQARKAREAAAKEEARLLAQAEAARSKGNEVRAEALENRAMNVTAAPPPPPPKAAGVADRTVWKYEITNAALVPMEYRVIDEKRIGAMVRSMKADTNIPGVRVWSEKDYSVRGGM